MAKQFKIKLNDKAFFAEEGDVLLDVILDNGILLPHSCRAGNCHSCKITDLNQQKNILSCQTTIHDDLILSLVKSNTQTPIGLKSSYIENGLVNLMFESSFRSRFFKW